MGKQRCIICDIPKSRLLLLSVTAIILVFSLNYIVTTSQLGQAAPRQLYTVRGESMTPTLHDGTQVYVQWIPPNQYVPGDHEDRTGDIIFFNATIFLAYGDFPTFSGNMLIVVHRIIDRTYQNGHWFFKTQGDNLESNASPDEFSWQAYQTGTPQPDWFGTSGWLEDTLILGKVIEIVNQTVTGMGGG